MHALRELMLRHIPGDGHIDTPVPGITLVRLAQPNEPTHVLHQPAACFIVQGAKQVILSDQSYQYDPAKYLVVSVELPLMARVIEASPQRPYLCLRISLDAAILAAVLMEHGTAKPAKGSVERGLFVSAVTPELTDALVRLLRLLDNPADRPFLAPLVQREIYYRLLNGEQGAAVRHIATAESKLRQIGHAIAWIKQHYAEPFSIDTVAAQARMSPSALHHYFKAVTAMSPLQYQKQIRLQVARRLLVSQALDAATAGHEVGYDSPSQFTREYRRLFGVPPGRDASRLRGEETELTDA